MTKKTTAVKETVAKTTKELAGLAVEKATLEGQLNELDRSLVETMSISQEIRKIGEEMARRVQEARERVLAINAMLEKGAVKLDELDEKTSKTTAVKDTAAK